MGIDWAETPGCRFYPPQPQEVAPDGEDFRAGEVVWRFALP